MKVKYKTLIFALPCQYGTVTFAAAKLGAQVSDAGETQNDFSEDSYTGKERKDRRERERVIGCFAEVGNKFRRSLSGEKGIIFVATFGKHTDHIANCAGEGKRPFGNLRRRREQLTTGGGRSIGGGREHHWGRAKARLAWRCRGKQHRWGRRGDLRQHLEGLKGKAKERVSRK